MKMSKSSQKIQTRIVKCPSCKASTRYDETNEHRPFCSERCRVLDTGAWADEEYKVPGEPAYLNPEEEEY